MHDLTPGARHRGEILLDGVSIFAAGTDTVALRRRAGMVFQRPNPFPKSVFDNAAYGPRLNGLAPERELPDRVERALRQAALWDEVQDRLREPGTSLSSPITCSRRPGCPISRASSTSVEIGRAHV